MTQQIWQKFRNASMAAAARLLYEARAAKPARASVQADGTLELMVYEEIGENFWDGGGVTAKSVKQQMDAAGSYSKILLRINSPGGDAFEGLALFNLIRSAKKPIDVYIDGVAASAASIVAMAGDTITMGEGGLIMIHNAWALCGGFEADHRAMADTLARVSGSIGDVYAGRTGKSVDQVKALMDAETWMTAQEAVDNGFATAVAKPDAIAASLAEARKQLRHRASSAACACGCKNCAVGDCASCINEDCDSEGCTDCPIQNDDLEAARAALHARSAIRAAVV